MKAVAMTVDMGALRPYTPLLVLVLTIGVGWMLFIRPVSADQGHAAGQLTGLRQREMELRREVSSPSPRAVDVDPALTFERQVTSGDASPVLLEQLARLTSAARARNLLIETVEPGAAAVNAASRALQRDPRFALFDVPVTHVPIRVAFDADYTSLGRFLWSFRSLPTTVEIRSLSIGAPPPDSGDATSGTRADIVRASLTLHAYSRSAPAAIPTSNTVTR
jgi:hypothetical protein